jgi:hypothetical protein
VSAVLPIDADYFRQRLRYDGETGKLYWRPLDASNGRAAKIFNTRYAGNEAGKLTSNGRRTICIAGSTYQASRVIWAMKYGWCPDQIDHKDRDTLNNRLDNLRPATPMQNMANTVKPSKSGRRGVFQTPSKRWKAQIIVNGSCKYLGTYDDIEDAARQYRCAALLVHGQYASNESRKLAARNGAA